MVSGAAETFSATVTMIGLAPEPPEGVIVMLPELLCGGMETMLTVSTAGVVV